MDGKVVSARKVPEKKSRGVRSGPASVGTNATVNARVQNHVKVYGAAEKINRVEKSEIGTAEMGATAATHMQNHAEGYRVHGEINRGERSGPAIAETGATAATHLRGHVEGRSMSDVGVTGDTDHPCFLSYIGIFVPMAVITSIN